MSEKTIGTYTTKGFSHKGVTGSTPVKELSKHGSNSAITPQVMKENNSPVNKVVKDKVVNKEVGSGMPGNAGRVKK